MQSFHGRSKFFDSFNLTFNDMRTLLATAHRNDTWVAACEWLHANEDRWFKDPAEVPTRWMEPFTWWARRHW